jgi:hypothetical protein
VNDGILSGPIDMDGPRHIRHPSVGVLAGDRIRHVPSKTDGRLVRIENEDVVMKDVLGKTHRFLRTAGNFEVEGRRCLPVVGTTEASDRRQISASGSIAVEHEARVARPSRILVEGVHDAELVEKVWGDDLRHEGVVVERLDGMDDLSGVVAEFGPEPGHRLGILLDHLVDGSKESRAAAEVDDPDVLITGTPYVDVWAGVRPSLIGVDAWPEVPMGESWKEGILARIGRSGTHPGAFWKELLGQVTTYADLFPPLVGAVEQLIDFVTAPADPRP